MATEPCPGFMCYSRFFSLVIPAHILSFVIPDFFSCHSHENGNPGVLKSL